MDPSFLVRPPGRICRTVVSASEKPRIEIPQLFSEKYLILIKEYIPLVPTELIFNIDEREFNN
jgi:hypothetical protein